MQSENIFFLRKKDKYGDLWLLGKEDEWLLFCCAVFFHGGRTKVGGLTLKVTGFSLVESTVVFSFNPTWLVLAVGVRLKKKKMGFNTYNIAFRP